MCHLITIGITGGPNNPTDFFHEQGLHAEAAVNPHVRAGMPNGAIVLDVTDEGCSCNILGGVADGVVFDAAAERARYARKGWSAAKITRAIESKQAAHGRRKVHSKAEQFCLSVEALARSGSHIALISHNYSGLFASEVVSIGAQVCLPLQAFLQTRGALPEDTLVIVE